MAFLDKLKNGLLKTKNALFGQVDNILKAFVRVDEDMLDELECSDGTVEYSGAMQYNEQYTIKQLGF